MVSSDYYVQDNSDIENKTLEAAKNHYKNGKYSEALKLYLSLLNTSISLNCITKSADVIINLTT